MYHKTINTENMSQSPERFHENFKTPHVIITCIYTYTRLRYIHKYINTVSYTAATLLICLIFYGALYLAQSTDIFCPIESEVLEDLP